MMFGYDHKTKEKKLATIDSSKDKYIKALISINDESIEAALKKYSALFVKVTEDGGKLLLVAKKGTIAIAITLIIAITIIATVWIVYNSPNPPSASLLEQITELIKNIISYF